MLLKEKKEKTVRSVNSRITTNYVQQIRELKLYPIKVGMISCTSFQNMSAINKMFSQLRTLPNHITVLGAGNSMGADEYIKKMTLEVGFDFKEYNPIHTPFNEYSALPKYRYSKGYKPFNFTSRYNDLIKDCDKIIFFYNTGVQDKFLENAIKTAKKLEKQYVIMS